MEKRQADIIITGAGAAGLMAAVGAARTLAGSAGRSGKVIVLEKMARPGRKIMITGKGRCNFTNVKPWNEFSSHIHPKPNFLKPSFHNLTPGGMMNFFGQHGMESVVERGDRAFPASYAASDVVDTLLRAAERAGAETVCGKEVKTISRENEDESGMFRVECADGDIYLCRKVIICTGGLSYPRTGSTGDGYGWAQKFGHTVKPLFPSLTAIVPKGYKRDDSKGHIDRNTPMSELGRALCGIQLKNVNLSIIIDGNEVQSEFGDLDFTDGGIEGPVGFKVSRRCVNAIINGSKASAVLDLKPAVERNALESRIQSLWTGIANDRRSAGRQYGDRFRILLGKLMPQDLINAFLKMNPNADHRTLARTLKGWRFEIAGYVGYERCVITAGGVSLEEITSKTLESKKMPGLYLAGEILDMDADTGGYNLQTAFSTGYLAGISAAKSII